MSDHVTVDYLDVEPVPTVVVKATDFPLQEMGQLFDATFGAVFAALEERGLQPMGPAYSLHTRIPTDTADLEVGIPINGEFGEPVPIGDFALVASVLPGGSVAKTSYVGSYDGLGPAWGAFMEQVSADGHAPELPFWEIYVTEPSPEADPSTFQTDLVTLLAPTD